MFAPSDAIIVIQPVIIRLDNGTLLPLWKEKGKVRETAGDKMLVEFPAGTFWVPKKMCEKVG